MKRYVILAAAVAMQMCLGATYSWSVYVQPIKTLTGLLQGPVQMPFAVFYFVFPATMMISGSLLPRIGPRRCAVAGGVLFGSGWLLAGSGQTHFAVTVIGIGVLAGIGAGFAYIVPIATCIQWFPRHKGLVTGIAVAGFGGGAALVSQVGGHLMSTRGLTPFETFTVFGALFLGLVSVAGLAMVNPPAAARQAIRPLGLGRILSDRLFGLLYLAMFTGLAAGFTVNANLKELYAAGGLKVGIAAVSLFAVANASGRIGWGWLFDRWQTATAIQANLIAQALVLLSASWILRSERGLLWFALATGLNYGGVLVLYASATARRWGAQRVGQVYGWLFSANIPAALAPLAAGFSFDRSGSFRGPLTVLGALLLLAAIMIFCRRALLDGQTSAP